MFDVVRASYKSPPKRMAGCSGVGKVADNCDYKIHTYTSQAYQPIRYLIIIHTGYTVYMVYYIQ